MLTTVLNVAGLIIGPLTDYLAHRRKIKELTREAEIKAAENLAENIADADAQSVIDQKNTWKDEYITLIVTLPIVGCFIPPLAPYVKQGFEILKGSVPEWYVMLYAVIVLAVMGVRLFHKYVLPKVGK